MIVSVPDYQRTTANSIATLSYNLLGYLPAPFLYGLVSEIQGTGANKNDGERWALGTLMYWSIFSAIFLVIAYMSKERNVKKMQEKEKAEFKNIIT